MVKNKLKSRKLIKTKKTNIRNDFRTSFLISLLLHIVFFPLYLIMWYFKMMKYHFFKFAICNLAIIFAILGYFGFIFLTLPDINKLYYYKPVLSSKFYDRNDELIFEVGNERRTHIDINEVPKTLIYAFIAAEDKTFYTNYGFDIYGLARTVIQDVYKLIRGQKLAGASTITQQVVKNVLLTNERTLTRKIKELILSYRISKIMPKDKVMEVYLNHIYLGMQAYGIVSAAEEYFGKSVSQLTVPEMALLAGMPKAPSSINPFKNYNRAIARRNWVLQRMMEDEYITPDQYEQFSKTELIVKRKHNLYTPFYAPSFFAQSLLTAKETGLSKKNILNDGYKVKLTIDGELQRIAQEALNHSLESYSKKHGYTGALFSFEENDVKTKTPEELLKSIDEPENINKFMLAVVTDVQDNEAKIGFRNNNTGLISLNDLSWAKQKISEIEVSDKKVTKCSDVLKIGDVIVVDRKTIDSNYYTLEQLPQINGGVLALNPQTGEILAMVGGYADLAGYFNRTIQAFRQMGSTIKPFVYATALENGYTPASIFMDTDINMNIGDGIIWQPENDSKKTNGPMTLRMGLEKSRNTVTIRVADSIGMSKIRKKIIQTGLNANPENNLSVAIGSVESSLINMATAYSIFANGGKRVLPYLISYVRNITDKNVDDENETEQQNINVLDKLYFTNCDLNAKCQIVFKEEKENQSDIPQDVKNDIQTVQENENNNNDNKGQDDDQTLEKTENDDTITIFSPETSYQIANILQGAVLRGTSRKLSVLNLPIAAKTGTSNGGKDLWSIIISPELILISFVGYDIPIITDNYGATYALPINKEILSKISDRYKLTDFRTPEKIKFVKINRNTGKVATSDDNEQDLIYEAFKDTDDIVEKSANNTDDEDIDITDIQ